MIKDTLTAVKEALKTVPDLRYTAEDWGQLDFFNQPPVRFPCVLLDAEEVRYSDSGRGFQQGEASLTVRVADNRVFNGSFRPPPHRRSSPCSTCSRRCIRRYRASPGRDSRP